MHKEGEKKRLCSSKIFLLVSNCLAVCSKKIEDWMFTNKNQNTFINKKVLIRFKVGPYTVFEIENHNRFDSQTAPFTQ